MVEDPVYHLKILSHVCDGSGLIVFLWENFVFNVEYEISEEWFL